MKNLHKALSAIMIISGFTVSSQPSGTPQKSRNAAINDVPKEQHAKEEFIKNQDYLSLNTLKYYPGFDKDSLKGFDEMSVKAELLADNIFGQEYINYMKILKRRFIDDKHRI